LGSHLGNTDFNPFSWPRLQHQTVQFIYLFIIILYIYTAAQGLNQIWRDLRLVWTTHLELISSLRFL